MSRSVKSTLSHSEVKFNLEKKDTLEYKPINR